VFDFPVPKATQFKQSSAIEIDKPVCSRNAKSRLPNSAPPPVSMTPRSTMSAAKHGGTLSNKIHN
jgi:hypothetical protein